MDAVENFSLVSVRLGLHDVHRPLFEMATQNVLLRDFLMRTKTGYSTCALLPQAREMSK